MNYCRIFEFGSDRWSATISSVLLAVMGCVFLSAGSVLGADTTEETQEESPATSSEAEDVRDAVDFDLIHKRNIFDPERRSPRQRNDEPKPPPRTLKVDTLALTGIMKYAKGTFAFFDGSSSLYREAVEAGDSFAGYTIATIENSHVQLTNETRSIELKIGEQLRREDAGEWKITNHSGRISSSSNKGTTNTDSREIAANTSTSSSEPSDALKRLLEKRRKEQAQ